MSHAAYMRQRRARLRREGRCTRCGKKKLPERLHLGYCHECNVKNTEAVNQWRKAR